MGLRAAVVGGGIGGLCAAVGLSRRGHEVTVFERSRTIEAIGSAISLWPNALSAAEVLGVRDAIARRACPLPASVGPCVTDRGREVSLFDMAKLEHRVGRAVMIMRPDLVVGADGLNSVVRSAVWPEAKAPRYAGSTSYRLITEPLDPPQEIPCRLLGGAARLRIGSAPRATGLLLGGPGHASQERGVRPL